jgi:hypothetical protein
MDDFIFVPRTVLLQLADLAERATLDAEQALYQGQRLLTLLMEYSDENDRLRQQVRVHDLEHGEE